VEFQIEKQSAAFMLDAGNAARPIGDEKFQAELHPIDRLATARVCATAAAISGVSRARRMRPAWGASIAEGVGVDTAGERNLAFTKGQVSTPSARRWQARRRKQASRVRTRASYGDGNSATGGHWSAPHPARYPDPYLQPDHRSQQTPANI